MYKLLFVCTGNICRSPTAHAVFRHLVNKQGLQRFFYVDSAGTQGYHAGESPDLRAIRTAESEKIPISDLLARKVSPGDFDKFDLILAMDQGHLDQLKKLCPPESECTVALFLPYANHEGATEVPDPYYGTQADFDHTLSLCVQGSELLLQKLRQQLGV